MALSRGLTLHKYLDDWLIRSQSQKEALMNTQAVVHLDSVLGVDHKSGKIRTESYSDVFVRGLRVPPRFSHCKTHSREMAQTSGFDPTTQVKTCFDCKMFDVSNWVVSLNGEDVPEGRLHMRPSQSHLKEPPSLDRCHFCTPGLVAESCKCDERLRPSSKSQLFTDASNKGWGAHLDQISTKGLVRLGKKATHKRPRVEGSFTGPSKVQGPVSEPNSLSCNRQLNSGRLHKQRKRNSLSGGVCTPVEDHDMVPSLSHNIESQTHSKVSECDGRPPVQVQPSAVDRMVTASTGVQTDLRKVVHPSCRPVCYSSEPQTPSLRV